MPKKIGKQERMELRRKIGNRVITPPPEPPLHRGPDYLISHACFQCRKSWKRSEEREHVCPECQRPLAMMGRSFSAPKKREVDKWTAVRKLWNAGFRFWSYRNYPGGEKYPEELREIDAFIRRNPDHPMRIAKQFR